MVNVSKPYQTETLTSTDFSDAPIVIEVEHPVCDYGHIVESDDECECGMIYYECVCECERCGMHGDDNCICEPPSLFESDADEPDEAPSDVESDNGFTDYCTIAMCSDSLCYRCHPMPHDHEPDEECSDEECPDKNSETGPRTFAEHERFDELIHYHNYFYHPVITPVHPERWLVRARLNATWTNGSNKPPAGLSMLQIELLPTSCISEHQVGTQCTICMEKLELGETVRTIACYHYFHKGCIERWLRNHKKCPVCRVHASPL